MPTTAKSRAWFYPTSPRSPYKIQGELRLLKKLEGRIWNRDTQTEFAEMLKNYNGFEGKIWEKEPDFSARDRINRAPRLLGFIYIPKNDTRQTLKFTNAGNTLIEASENEIPYIFQKQMAKVQFKSPLHCSRGFENMSIKPLILMIRLLLELETFDKYEISFFACTMINHSLFEECVEKIREFRNKLSSKSPGRERKEFKRQYAESIIKTIYEEDIRQGNIGLREGGSGLEKFVKTKISNLRDYADATTRYLRITGLFTITEYGRMRLSPSLLKDSIYLSKSMSLQAVEFSDDDYENYINDYLGNINIPKIYADNRKNQKKDINRLLKIIKVKEPNTAKTTEQEFENAADNHTRITILNSARSIVSRISMEKEKSAIQQKASFSYEQIKSLYNDISANDSDILDRPLMYEWNAWRSFVLLDDAISINGHFSVDADGKPNNVAPGGKSDIEIEYKSFWLAVEVTLQRGYKQYEEEGESIVRHVGNLQLQRRKSGDLRPVYGLFLTEKLNNEVISYLLAQARYESQVFQGTIRILPICRKDFLNAINKAIEKNCRSQSNFAQILSYCFSETMLKKGEIDWYKAVLSYIAHEN